MTDHGMGWIPDLPDHRDFRYAALVAAPPVQLPPLIDLRAGCSPIEDQGAIGSCTAQALIGACEYLDRMTAPTVGDLSRLFVYYNERALEGTTRWDSGAYLRDGMKTLAAQGVCLEALWPYRTWRMRCKPSRRSYADATGRTISSYHRILSVDEMRQCLADGFPFVFGFTVYASFKSAAVAKSGDVPMPGPSERVIGGHAVMAVGYDDAAQTFLCRNSWGEGWGKRGYFTMPYAYLADRNLSDDFWTIRAEASL